MAVSGNCGQRHWAPQIPGADLGKRRSVGGMSIRLGYQIPNFSYSTPVRDLFPTVITQAREAEAAGFDAVFVMDHFYQLPGIGEPDEPMLEVVHGTGRNRHGHRVDPAVGPRHRQHVP
ncbi:hypothetical protein P9209_21495 [Prescottella defluvii]|nr:hypothetical protein P9209_21495 [Prescottella defluvii]